MLKKDQIFKSQLQSGNCTRICYSVFASQKTKPKHLDSGAYNGQISQAFIVPKSIFIPFDRTVYSRSISICEKETDFYTTIGKKRHTFFYFLFTSNTQCPLLASFGLIFCLAIQANLASLQFSPVCCPAISSKKAPPVGNNCMK